MGRHLKNPVEQSKDGQEIPNARGREPEATEFDGGREEERLYRADGVVHKGEEGVVGCCDNHATGHQSAQGDGAFVFILCVRPYCAPRTSLRCVLGAGGVRLPALEDGRKEQHSRPLGRFFEEEDCQNPG